MSIRRAPVVQLDSQRRTLRDVLGTVGHAPSLSAMAIGVGGGGGKKPKKGTPEYRKIMQAREARRQNHLEGLSVVEVLLPWGEFAQLSRSNSTFFEQWLQMALPTDGVLVSPYKPQRFDDALSSTFRDLEGLENCIKYLNYQAKHVKAQPCEGYTMAIGFRMQKVGSLMVPGRGNVTWDDLMKLFALNGGVITTDENAVASPTHYELMAQVHFLIEKTSANGATEYIDVTPPLPGDVGKPFVFVKSSSLYAGVTPMELMQLKHMGFKMQVGAVYTKSLFSMFKMIGAEGGMLEQAQRGSVSAKDTYLSITIDLNNPTLDTLLKIAGSGRSTDPIVRLTEMSGKLRLTDKGGTVVEFTNPITLVKELKRAEVWTTWEPGAAARVMG